MTAVGGHTECGHAWTFGWHYSDTGRSKTNGKTLTHELGDRGPAIHVGQQAAVPRHAPLAERQSACRQVLRQVLRPRIRPKAGNTAAASKRTPANSTLAHTRTQGEVHMPGRDARTLDQPRRGRPGREHPCHRSTRRRYNHCAGSSAEPAGRSSRRLPRLHIRRQGQVPGQCLERGDSPNITLRCRHWRGREPAHMNWGRPGGTSRHDSLSLLARKALIAADKAAICLRVETQRLPGHYHAS